MKSITAVIIIILLLTLSLTPTLARATDAPPQTQWQYAILFLNGPNPELTLALPGKDPVSGPISVLYQAMNATEPTQDKTLNNFLNILGADRWELVTIQNGNYYFKRPK